MRSSSLFVWLATIIQSCQAIIPFPAIPEIPENELVCLDTDICCQQRYPDFIVHYSGHRRRKQNVILSKPVRVFNPTNGRAYADYKCTHTVAGYDQDVPPDVPGVIKVSKRYSRQQFRLVCDEGFLMHPDPRPDTHDALRSRVAGVCMTPDQLKDHLITVEAGKTVCENKVAPRRGRKRQVAEVHQDFTVDPDLDGLLDFLLTEVGDPNVQQQGVEAISMEAQPGRIYRACASGSGQFSFEIGSSSSSSFSLD